MIHKAFTKATLLVSALTLLSTATQANAPKTGIYVGAALGGAAMTGKSTINVSRLVPALAAVVPANYSPTVSDKNVAGDIFIGFGKRFNCFWVAFEALASFTSLNSKNLIDITPLTTSGNGQSLQFKTTNAWGAAFNLGYHINQASKLYVKLGFECRRFRTTLNANLPPNDPNLLNLNQSKNSTAFVPGLGMDTEICPRLSLRTEYRVALHNGKTVQAANSPTQYSSVKTKPTIHYFNLGLTFKI
jgi:opacity protein-like surface antigen